MNIIKYAIMLVVCNLLRLLRFIPNFDPIMGSMLPFAKQDKWWASALFALLTMVSFDIITGFLGIWTAVTALTYAGLGVFFHFYYKNQKKVTLKTYVGSGVLGVLIYDFITGVIAGPAMFGMNYYEAFLGQIPFTLMHLVSVTAFVLILTPLLDKHVVQNTVFDDNKLVARFLTITK
ncbi:MAG: DUF6580 family putative transport protein [Candidatus Micrarchaeota archaeon]